MGAVIPTDPEDHDAVAAALDEMWDRDGVDCDEMKEWEWLGWTEDFYYRWRHDRLRDRADRIAEEPGTDAMRWTPDYGVVPKGFVR